MLYSFDVDKTLFIKYKNLREYSLNPVVAVWMLRSLEGGDVILINTANPMLIKSNKLMYDLLWTLYAKDKNGKDLFDVYRRATIYQNMLKNFYIAQKLGQSLRHVIPMNRKDFENGGVFDRYCPEDYLGSKTAKIVYNSNIKGSDIERLKNLLCVDGYFKNIINSRKFAVVNEDGISQSRYIEKFFDSCPEKVKNCTFYVGRKEEYTKEIASSEKEKINKIIKDNNLNLDVVAVKVNVIILSPKEIVVTKFCGNERQQVSKALPIKVLRKIYKIPAKDCIHFGNEESDVLDQTIAKTVIVGEYFETLKKERLAEKGVMFAPNVLSEIMKKELLHILNRYENSSQETKTL